MKRLILYITLLAWSLSAQSQGSEMLRNGSFSTTDYWTTETGWSISNDSARWDAQPDFYKMYQTDADMISSIQPNTTYLLEFDIIVLTDTSARIWVRTSDNVIAYGLDQPIIRSSTRASYEFTTPSDIGVGGFAITGHPTPNYNSFVIDNISLAEVANIGNSPYYVAVDGHDAASGDINNPWRTPEKAMRSARTPGDTVYIRGGVYYRTQLEGTIKVHGSESTRISDDTIHSGTPGNYIHYWGYPPDLANGDSAIFDFSLISPADVYPEETYNTGLDIWDAGYLHFKNLTIQNVWQKYKFVYATGINERSNHNMIYENITVRYIGGIGWFSTTSDWAINNFYRHDSILGTISDSTYYINCDVHNSVDSLPVNANQEDLNQAGSQAQGFFIVNYPGCYYEFDGCRSWQCADDGYNLVPVGGEIRTKNTWSFMNGFYLPDLDYTTPGNGFKLNNPTTDDEDIMTWINTFPDNISHYVTNSIAIYNKGYGFSENHRTGGPSLYRNNYNNLAYKNVSFGFGTQQAYPEDDPHRDNRYINNLSYDNIGGDAVESQGAFFKTDITNSWTTPPGVTVTDADFLSLPVDSLTAFAALSAPRQADGSLPSLGDYFQLDPTSGLIDAGTDVGMSTTPDIGIDWAYLDAGSPPVDLPTAVSRSPISFGTGGIRLFFNGKYLK